MITPRPAWLTRRRFLLGAGTVLDAETARAALLAGAEFLVAPTLNLDVIRLCSRYDKVVMPGAFTPTEILAAWEAGADIVKVFPADVVGPAFFKAMRGPLPQIRLMPTGGVTIENAREWLDAGSVALGVGSHLTHGAKSGDFASVTALARQFMQRASDVGGLLEPLVGRVGDARQRNVLGHDRRRQRLGDPVGDREPRLTVVDTGRIL